MAIFSYRDVENRINLLKERGTVRDDMVMQYILSPYVQSLGYNIFNLEEVEKVDDGTYKVTVFEDEDVQDLIYFIFSTTDLKTRYLGDNGVRSYLHLSMNEERIILSHKVFGKWVSVYDAKFNVTEEDKEDLREEEDSFIAINKLMNKTEFNRKYLDIGERFFSGTVIDSYLANRDYQNDFIEDIIVSELLRPSEEFKSVIALGLKKYSLQSLDWIMESLDGISGKDIIDNVEEALGKGMITLKNSSRRTRKTDKNNEKPLEDKEESRKEGNKDDILERVRTERKRPLQETMEEEVRSKVELEDVDTVEIQIDSEAEDPFELLEQAGFDVGESISKGTVERRRVEDRQDDVTGMVDIMSSLD